MLGQLFGSCDEKVQLWRKAHFEVKMYKRPHVRATFGGLDVVSHLVQSEQNCEGFVAFPKTMAGVEHLKGICKDADGLHFGVSDL